MRHKLIVLAALTPLLNGCSGVLDPQGPIGRAERIILIDATVVMLAVVIPVILATIAFAWWFRAGNDRAIHLPDWEFSGPIETVVWSIPALVVLFLGGIAWIASHDLDPPKPIASKALPIEIQVVSLDWKWLFFYPGQGVASVNRLVIPAGIPVRFRLTSASVMNSFFVPQLGSQIYAMSGMTTQLNLLADKPGAYRGLSAQFSGDGFSDMDFAVDALPPAAFAAWAADAKARGKLLDAGAYKVLLKPTSKVPPGFYGTVQPGLFEAIATGRTPDGQGPQTGRGSPTISPRSDE